MSNPPLAAAPSKAHYRETLDQPDSTLDSDTTNSATKFLTTFFKLYPNGSLNELKYYVKGPVQAIHQDYRFAELAKPVYHRVGKKLRADITVKYLDSTTDMTQFAQYQLLLSKSGQNWSIESGLD
ncbi:conjugal transfer protein [Pediococcus acidilactici]|uniref:conjugal transfer protein n=1 Tax=Pediococcus acidilactici TaxID=1254 RepID=UPI000FFE108D|nr:conjugal transfer protein [Pediococcus acidilactici]QAT20856.1 conjugal transfer protein [Pediococcus acidilactici]